MVDTVGSGAVVNISSRSASMTQTSFVAYGAAKAALDRLTRNMAPELAPRVRFNAIDVGGVATRSLDIVLTDDDLRRQFLDGTPMRRPGEPEDIACAVLYLVSDASSWVTGKVFEVDGGTEARHHRADATARAGVTARSPPCTFRCPFTRRRRATPSRPASFPGWRSSRASSPRSSTSPPPGGGGGRRLHPGLANVDPSLFAVSIVGVGGGSFSVGDASHLFSLQSISKAFVFALVCDAIGHEEARRKLGVNATGLGFNSVMAIELNEERTMNPMVNAGAMATTSLVPGDTTEERWEFIREGLSRFAGRELELDEEVYASESATNLRNQGIAHLLQSYGRLYADPDETTDLYTRQCSLLVSGVRPGGHGGHPGQRGRAADDRPARRRAVSLQACARRGRPRPGCTSIPVTGSTKSVSPGRAASAGAS